MALGPARGLGLPTSLAVALLGAVESGRAQSLEWRGGVNVVGHVADDSRVRGEVVGSFDLFLDLGLGPTLLATYLEVNTTPFSAGVSRLIPEANTDAGTALTGDGRGRAQVSEMRLVVPVAPDLRLHGGLLDATGFLDVSRIANDENLFFLGVPFVNNPTIHFPDYSLGVAMEGTLPFDTPVGIGATVVSSHGLADNPDASYGELLDVGGHRKGVFAGATARWDGPTRRGSVGVWVNSARHARLDGSGGSESNRGLFSVIGWTRGSHTMSARVGVANGAVHLPTGFAGLTYLYDRSPGAVGLAVGRTFNSNERPEARSVSHGEAFFRGRLLRDIYFTVSGQRIVNSGFDATGRTVAPRLWLGGVRLSASF